MYGTMIALTPEQQMEQDARREAEKQEAIAKAVQNPQNAMVTIREFPNRNFSVEEACKAYAQHPSQKGMGKNAWVAGAYTLMGATAMAVSYSRNQSLLKSFGAGLVSLPYLIYVAIDSRKK